MKCLLLLSLLILSVTTFAQDSTNTLTAERVYQDAKDGFKKLVENLEGPAKHTYEIYVRQHVVSGVSYLAISIIMMIVCLSFLRYSWSRAKIEKIDYLNTNWNTWAYARLVFSIASGISFFVFCSVFFNGVLSEIINPEYHAIQDIIKAFK